MNECNSYWGIITGIVFEKDCLEAGGKVMAEDTLFSGESKNVEYKITVPEKSEKYMKRVVAFANGAGGKIVLGIDDKTLEIAEKEE